MKSFNINVDTMLFRCSSLGRLVGNPKDIDECLITDEIRVIKAIRSDKRTPQQKEIINEALRNSLSATAKTLVKEMIRQKVHDAPYKFSGSKETEKGHEVEDAAILYLMKNEFISARKNDVRFSNAWISGEPDVISNRIVYDTKCPWSYWTMPYFSDDIESKSVDAGYDWQQQGYIWLCNDNGIEVDSAQLKYILMPTPERLINKYEDSYLHTEYVTSLPASDRIRTYHIKKDLERIELIKVKVNAGRRYAKQLLEQL